MIAKITKNLKFELSKFKTKAPHNPADRCYCHIKYNNKSTKHDMMGNELESGDVKVDGPFELFLDFDKQSNICDGSSSSGTADIDCRILVEVAGAHFVKEEKVPPIH